MFDLVHMMLTIYDAAAELPYHGKGFIEQPLTLYHQGCDQHSYSSQMSIGSLSYCLSQQPVSEGDEGAAVDEPDLRPVRGEQESLTSALQQRMTQGNEGAAADKPDLRPVGGEQEPLTLVTTVSNQDDEQDHRETNKEAHTMQAEELIATLKGQVGLHTNIPVGKWQEDVDMMTDQPALSHAALMNPEPMDTAVDWPASSEQAVVNPTATDVGTGQAVSSTLTNTQSLWSAEKHQEQRETLPTSGEQQENGFKLPTEKGQHKDGTKLLINSQQHRDGKTLLNNNDLCVPTPISNRKTLLNSNARHVTNLFAHEVDDDMDFVGQKQHDGTNLTYWPDRTQHTHDTPNDEVLCIEDDTEEEGSEEAYENEGSDASDVGKQEHEFDWEFVPS